MRAAILSAVVALAPSALRAEPAVPAIDEAAFVAELSASEPRTALAATRIMAARAEVTAAGARPDPSLAVEREDPRGASEATTYLRVALPIDVSGRRGLALAAAETEVRAATSAVHRDQHALVFDGLRAFDDCAYARLYLAVLVEARRALVRAVAIARTRGAAGDASGYEVQRFELELARHDDDIASARAALDRARARLAALLGRTTPLDAASELALPATVPALEALLATAGERADLRAARLRGDAAGRRAAAARRAWVPTPTLTAGTVTVAVGDDTTTGYVAGLALSIPLFDHGQGDRARATAAQRAAELEARWLERSIPSEIRIAHADLVATLAQARTLTTEQVARLDTILTAAETAFREGHATVVELLDAHRTARDVRLRALELRHRVVRAARELALAAGSRP